MLLAQVHQLQTEVQSYRKFSQNPFAAGGAAGPGAGQGVGQGSACGGGPGSFGPKICSRKFSFGFHKCDDCVLAKTQCNHCRKCGEEGHKKAVCPN